MVKKEIPDEELLNRLQSSDIKAFDEIYRRYWLGLFKTANHKTGSRFIAEELVQDLFASLWLRREELKVGTSLKNYLYSAIKNLVISHIRKEIVARKFSPVLQGIDNSTENSLDFEELKQTLEKAVSQMSNTSQEVFRLSRYDGQSTKKIAEQLQISDKAVEYHLTKTLKFIKKYLNDFILFIATFLMY